MPAFVWPLNAIRDDHEQRVFPYERSLFERDLVLGEG
jgi:hypothetical protein